jgi:hypothetical protein
MSDCNPKNMPKRIIDYVADVMVKRLQGTPTEIFGEDDAFDLALASYIADGQWEMGISRHDTASPDIYMKCDPLHAMGDGAFWTVPLADALEGYTFEVEADDAPEYRRILAEAIAELDARFPPQLP